MPSANKNPVAIDRIDHVVLLVSDLKRAARFYTEVLGLWVERWREEFGLVQLRCGDSMIDLQLGPRRRAQRRVPGRVARQAATRSGNNMHHLALNLARFDGKKLAAHFAKCGVRCSAPRKQYGADGTGWAMDVIDRDGNIVELKGPPNAAERRAATEEQAAARRRRRTVPKPPRSA